MLDFCSSSLSRRQETQWNWMPQCCKADGLHFWNCKRGPSGWDWWIQWVSTSLHSFSMGRIDFPSVAILSEHFAVKLAFWQIWFILSCDEKFTWECFWTKISKNISRLGWAGTQDPLSLFPFLNTWRWNYTWSWGCCIYQPHLVCDVEFFSCQDQRSLRAIW